MSKNRGQGIIEGVFALGVLGLVLSGVVVLIVMTMSNKKVILTGEKQRNWER